MFEDIVCPNTNKNNKKTKYICAFATTCDSKYCLHRLPHGKNELGRPEQPENEPPWNCIETPCVYLGMAVYCIEIR